MLKVLHVIPSISRRRGGPSVAALEMVAALRQTGVDASILTTNDDGPCLDATMPLGSWFEREGVPVLAFGRWSPPLTPLREFAFSPGLNRWLAAHLHEHDLLHVHALFSWPSTSAMAQARRAGVPYVLSTIGQLCRWSLRQSPRRKRLLLRLIERRNLEGAAALHFTTEAERQEAADLGLAAPPLVLPLGVNPPAPVLAGSEPLAEAAELAPAPGTGPTRFLFLSRLHPKKQLERLLEALALLDLQQPGARWQLEIAGEGEDLYEADLRSRAAALGLEGRIHWLGFLSGAPKWQALAAADWFVLPSASENFGIAAIEALAAGTPVILSPEVAVAAAVQQANAGLICASEPSQLAACLAGALGGPGPTRRAAARSLARDTYGWPAIAAELQHAYTSLLP